MMVRLEAGTDLHAHSHQGDKPAIMTPLEVVSALEFEAKALSISSCWQCREIGSFAQGKIKLVEIERSAYPPPPQVH